MKRFAFLLIIILIMPACTELELASHLTKQMIPSNKKTTASAGTFKVGSPYKIKGKKYYPEESYDLVQTGIASWYGPGFHGKQTANGEIFDQNELTAAHKTLQMPSLVRVTNLDNGRSLIVRINDRGPYKRGRIIDLSKRAAELLDFKNKGVAKVKIQVLKQESLRIAEAAKRGVNTSGFELAANRGEPLPGTQAPVYKTPVQQPQPAVSRPPARIQTASIDSEVLVSPLEEAPILDKAIPGHTKNGIFYPDPIVSETAVTSSQIYIQTGAFSVRENAYKLSAKLQNIHASSVMPVTVDGTPFYRVRVGPVSSVPEADKLLNRLVQNGYNEAIIVVE